VVGLGGRSGLTVAKEVAMGETEVGMQFRVCRFENLGMIDNRWRYRDYKSKVLDRETFETRQSSTYLVVCRPSNLEMKNRLTELGAG